MKINWEFLEEMATMVAAAAAPLATLAWIVARF
jgi:hypothetical protein